MNPWKRAIDNELVTLGTTADTYATPAEAVKALIDWHVSVALDPAVSSDAQALVERGAVCKECRGSGARDSGGVQPWGEPIMLACECKDAETGRQWREDSSLGRWFPMTAERVEALQRRVTELEHALRVVAQANAWREFGECRSFGADVRLLEPREADMFAKYTLRCGE